MIQSLIYSFQEYDGLSAAQYVGLKNYQDLFHADNYAFWDSLKYSNLLGCLQRFGHCIIRFDGDAAEL